MARYLERAEWRARFVDVNYHLLIESSPRDTEPWSPLLAITGDQEQFAARYSQADQDSVLGFFTFDTNNPSSIRSCISAARENARALRHRISSELWFELNTLYLDSQGWSAELIASEGVFQFFSALKDRFYRIAGISHGTMPRDLSYDFIQLGAMLERADNVTRLLDAKYHFLLPSAEQVGGPVDTMQWGAVLRCASALEAYRSRYGNLIEVEQLVDFLLFDGSFPRSARFSLDSLEVSLARISSHRSQSPRANPDTSTLEWMLTTRNASSIIRDGLHQFLMAVQDECSAIGNGVFDAYLRFE
jgi:uncharacterized alpha-E superfamily protein